jgi:hypothetical protein
MPPSISHASPDFEITNWAASLGSPSSFVSDDVLEPAFHTSITRGPSQAGPYARMVPSGRLPTARGILRDAPPSPIAFSQVFVAGEDLSVTFGPRSVVNLGAAPPNGMNGASTATRLEGVLSRPT